MNQNKLAQSLSLLGCTLLVSLFYASISQAQSPPCVDAITLDPSPEWVSSFEYDPRSDSLILTDPKNERSWRIDPDSKTTSLVDNLSAIKAFSLTPAPGGFLAEVEEGYRFLSSDLQHSEPLQTRYDKRGVPSGLGSLYSGWIANGTRFVGFGSITDVGANLSQANPRDLARKFELGVLAGNLDPATAGFSDVRLIRKLEYNDYYLIGHQYFAAHQDGFVFAEMAPGLARLWRLPQVGEPQSISLEGLAKRYREVDEIDPGPSKVKVVELYSKIENMTLITGVFSQGTKILLLTREPEGTGETRWLLHSVGSSSDPAGNTGRDPIVLPTTSNHIVVAQARDFWYILEKGFVRGWGDQEIQRILKIPASWIEDRTSSPLTSPTAIHLEICAGTSRPPASQ